MTGETYRGDGEQVKHFAAVTPRVGIAVLGLTLVYVHRHTHISIHTQAHARTHTNKHHQWYGIVEFNIPLDTV